MARINLCAGTSGTHVQTPTPRFDLHGCLVLASSSSTASNSGSNITQHSQVDPMSYFVEEWKGLLENSFVSRVLQSRDKSLASEANGPGSAARKIEALARLCTQSLVDCGFVVVIGSAREIVPELEHHEFDQGSPGYTLKEACEVSILFRCFSVSYSDICDFL